MLTQSQISKILNLKRPRGPFDVNPLQVQKLRPDSKRIRTGSYTELEAALYQWQQFMQKNGQVGISGLMLQEKAMHFWEKMPIYAQFVMPKFSQGWLTAFKKPYKIRKFILHWESGSADHSEETEMLMKAIQNILSIYERKDIYNMDETTLY